MGLWDNNLGVSEMGLWLQKTGVIAETWEPMGGYSIAVGDGFADWHYDAAPISVDSGYCTSSRILR